MVPPPASITFDVDDTLYLERDYARSGFRAAGAWAERALGLGLLAERAWAAFEAGVRGRVFDVALRDCGCTPTPALVQQLVEVYRAHVPDIALLPDAHALLPRLHPRAALACVTDGPLRSQQAKAQALQLARWLSPLVLTAQWGPGFEKPHPRAFALVEEAHGVRAESCVYVADNPAKDFVAPHARGWRTVRLRRAGGLHAARASGADVDHELPDLEGLPGLLGLQLG
ncbi:HAD family hydrolase [Aggregicoccus sp. 17bor-14]|uniref:HAD family hydrolase n=1 Tax=Myxococcaceae TaxID=31 RepID=UPI00129CD14D|nr:HAD family hydrolase [Simulacricoccus sp. 17bor-14]MRI89516.1 HAD family hydrolase [Aggregicoccus sp. 17bor-14]